MSLHPRSQNRKNRPAVTLRLESLEDRAVPDATFHNLGTSNFSQNWSNANLITTDDDWSGVPSIIGFLGQDITTSTGVDPQTLLTTSAVAGDVDVIANQTNPNTLATGGVAEFTGANVNNDNVVALQGSGTADVPYLLIHLNTTSRQTITISYNLRDIDGSTDNAIQPLALQYRVGTTGNFTNLSAGYVADATTGPSLATLVTPVSVVLPAAAQNQSQVQVRVMTTNAAGVDEWVGVDDITVTSVAIPTAAPSVTSPGAATAVNAATFTITGTAVANALVKVYSDANNNGLIDGADAVVSMQSLGAGVTAFSIPTTLTANAANNFVVTATATPLGESAPVDVPTITADSLAPALPVVTNPGAPTSVNAATFAVAGTAEAGSLVKVYRDVNNNGAIDAGIDTVVAQQQLSGGGVNFSIPTTLAQDTVNTFVVTATDAAGNESAPADVPTITEDSLAPALPVVTSPGTATAVNAATFTITGTAVANALVKVYSDANNNGLIDGADAVVSMQSLGAGVTAFSIPTTLTANAANNFVVTATATPLGESAPVDVPTITADSLAPALPVVTNPGAPTSVNAATFAVAGTAEAGSLVKVYRDVNNNGAIDAGIDTVVAQQQLSGGGVNFSIPTTLAQDTVNTFVVTATDAAGNESAPADVPTITEDSLAPALPVVTSPGAATTVSATTFTITGTAEANALVKVYSDVNNNGAIDGADAVVGMQQLGTGITAFSISVPLVANAANNFTVTATDAAANQSSPADVPTITQDSTAPALPVVTSPTSAVTVNAATFAITGTAEVNSLVRVFLDANNDGVADNPASPVAQQQLTAGATAFSISTPLTQDAANNFVVTATDVASNQSTPTDVPTITEDSTTPANPTVTSPAAPVTVNATTFAVAGTAEANALVKVYSDANNNGAIDAGDTVVAQQQLTGGATGFSISVPLLQNADNTFVATATDAAGNESFATDVPTITAATPPTPVPTPTPVPAATPTVSKSARAQFIAVGTDAGATAAVRVLDATTGRAVRNDIVPFGGFAGGVSVALGDVTGDGVADVIVGTATGGAHVKVFDGVTGAEVRSFLAFDGFAGGVTLAAGDVDGDGRADIIVGTADGGAHVKVFSGRDGSLLQSFFAFDGFGGGVKVAAGDVNGDRKADIAVLAGPGGNGHVKVFDAANRAQVASFLGYAGYTGEINLAVGDVDGDGRAEVVTTALNSTGGTHVKAFDTRGATVRSFFASTTAGTVATDFGSRRTARLPVVAPVEPPRVGVADVDGDGVADYLLGSPAGPATSRLFLVSGASNPPAASPLAFDNSFGTSGVFVDAK